MRSTATLDNSSALFHADLEENAGNDPGQLNVTYGSGTADPVTDSVRDVTIDELLASTAADVLPASSDAGSGARTTAATFFTESTVYDTTTRADVSDLENITSRLSTAQMSSTVSYTTSWVDDVSDNNTSVSDGSGRTKVSEMFDALLESSNTSDHLSFDNLWTTVSGGALDTSTPVTGLNSSVGGILSTSVFLNDTLTSVTRGQNSSVSEGFIIDWSKWPFIVLSVFVVFGVVGNVLVILAILLEKKLQNATNYFLLSLGIADLLVSAVVMPLAIVTEFYGEFFNVLV